MNPNLTCPTCKRELKVEHYREPYKKTVLTKSRLVCKNPVCGYMKEFPLKKGLFSEENKIKEKLSDE